MPKLTLLSRESGACTPHLNFAPTRHFVRSCLSCKEENMLCIAIFLHEDKIGGGPRTPMAWDVDFLPVELFTRSPYMRFPDIRVRPSTFCRAVHCTFL
eukprot:357499-Chlamydomonas_euryale.AAC.8